MTARSIAAAMLLTAATANAAVPSRTFDCTSNEGGQISMIIGDGEVQFLDLNNQYMNGNWSGNLCKASDPCGFNGSVYQVMADDWDVKFNVTDGSVEFATIDYEQAFKGICRPR